MLAPLDNFFWSIYTIYYVVKNPFVKFLFFFIALAFYILNIALYVVSFGKIASMDSIATGAYKIFGIEVRGYVHTGRPLNYFEQRNVADSLIKLDKYKDVDEITFII